MKTNLFAAILLSGVTGVAGAVDCGSTPLTDAVVSLDNTLVCGTAASGSDTWQEEHHTGGDLREYAQGPGDPIDPSHDVGTWSGAGGAITYNYTGGPSYTFSVYADNANPNNPGDLPFNVAFCDGPTLIATATVQVIDALNGCSPTP